jgi:hypothetical protein
MHDSVIFFGGEHYFVINEVLSLMKFVLYKSFFELNTILIPLLDAVFLFLFHFYCYYYYYNYYTFSLGVLDF